MSEDGGSQKEPEKSQRSKKERCTYNPRHLIALLGLVAADNPYQFASNAARLKVWDETAKAMRDQKGGLRNKHEALS
ncbi:hypothetical protein RvY_16345 [Ramazzottius varieornatus]|uniref:Uncharacterized protein n=1 Tax=Ramazzottius varieornatus TaxID=947166 RepID=A0A1D1VY46_RAMVA|nr:hypothetical protein RvY_16345 [Ramazzottius varieornatus]